MVLSSLASLFNCQVLEKYIYGHCWLSEMGSTQRKTVEYSKNNSRVVKKKKKKTVDRSRYYTLDNGEMEALEKLDLHPSSSNKGGC